MDPLDPDSQHWLTGLYPNIVQAWRGILPRTGTGGPITMRKMEMSPAGSSPASHKPSRFLVFVTFSLIEVVGTWFIEHTISIVLRHLKSG
jgi:hypothetical protein